MGGRRPGTGEFSVNPPLPFPVPMTATSAPSPVPLLSHSPAPLLLSCQGSLVGSDEDQSDATGLQKASEDPLLSPQQLGDLRHGDGHLEDSFPLS